MSQTITTPVIAAATPPIAALAAEVVLLFLVDDELLLVALWFWRAASGTRKLLSDDDEKFACEPEVALFVFLLLPPEVAFLFLLLPYELELLPNFEVELRIASSASQGATWLAAAAVGADNALDRNTATSSSESVTRRCIVSASVSEEKVTGGRGELTRWS